MLWCVVQQNWLSPMIEERADPQEETAKHLTLYVDSRYSYEDAVKKQVLGHRRVGRGLVNNH
jgi:hypothetical protein|eukprot:COSAG02_NODE_5839_length_3997_cov_5.153412_7_plen_62_part_00